MDGGHDLRPLDPSEARQCHAYPLPEGIPDAIMNKAQLATALDVSPNTITDWLRKGLPVEDAGTNGRAYEFRLSVCWAWVSAMRAEDHASRARGDQIAAQMQMALLGGETATPDARGRMTLKEQREAIQLELIRTQAARERGDLIRRPDVVDAFEAAFAAIRDAMDAGPDRLARELALPPDQVERAVALFDDVLSGAVAAVGEVFDHDGSGEG